MAGLLSKNGSEKSTRSPTVFHAEHVANGRPMRAVGVDGAIKAANLRRLARIEGQIRGLRKMVETDRYCADILDQVAAVQAALRSVARELMRNHLHFCATKSLRAGGEPAEQMIDELLALMAKTTK